MLIRNIASLVQCLGAFVSDEGSKPEVLSRIQGFCFSIFGKGSFGSGILLVFSNKLGETSQMIMFLMFSKGGLELHVVIYSFDQTKERTSR